MLFVRLQTKRTRQLAIEKLTFPSPLTIGIDTPRSIIDIVQQIGLKTCAAERDGTIGTFGFRPGGLIEGVKTYGACGRHRCVLGTADRQFFIFLNSLK